MTASEFRAVAEFCGITLPQLLAELQHFSVVEILAAHAANQIAKELDDAQKAAKATVLHLAIGGHHGGKTLIQKIAVLNELKKGGTVLICNAGGTAVVHPADEFDRQTKQGKKLNLLTGQYE